MRVRVSFVFFVQFIKINLKRETESTRFFCIFCPILYILCLLYYRNKLLNNVPFVKNAEQKKRKENRLYAQIIDNLSSGSEHLTILSWANRMCSITGVASTEYCGLIGESGTGRKVSRKLPCPNMPT